MSSVSQSFISGSIIMFALKMTQRVIGILSTFILARILTPLDFATIAIIALTVEIFQILSDAGSADYILQRSKVDSVDLDTAWTFNILTKSLLMFALILGAPWLAEFFNDPNLEAGLQVASIVLLLNALCSPGVWLLMREVDYSRLFWVYLAQKVVSVIVVISLALVLKNFWAIIVGELIGACVLLAGSYIIHSVRPKLALTKVAEQWRFSQWMLFKGVLGLLRAEVDIFLVSQKFDKLQLGFYHMSKGVALIPNEVISPLLEPLLAVLAKSKNDMREFGFRYSTILFATIFLTVPIVTFIAVFSINVIEILLGSQWLEARELLTALMLLIAFIPLNHVFYSAMTALGRVRQLFFYDLISLALVLVVLLPVSDISVEWFALLRGAIALFTVLSFYLFFSRIIGYRITRPILYVASIGSLGALSGFVSLHVSNLVDIHVFFETVIAGSVFSAVYLLGAWLLIRIHFHRYEEVAALTSAIYNYIEGYLPARIKSLINPEG